MAFQGEFQIGSTVFDSQLTVIESAINHQISVIRNQNERSFVRRAAENREDAEEIVRAYRTLSCLFDAFLARAICYVDSSTSC
jgi:hypothetical protein